MIQYPIRAKGYLVALATLVLLSGCKPVPVVTEADIPCQLPTSKERDQSVASEVAIQVDGSGSMLGYVKPANSRYLKTLDILDSIFISSQPKYYRSGGAKNQELSRQEFRHADSPDFYTGSTPKFPKVSSQLDAAITSPGEKKKLLVFVTDLEQNDADVNSLIAKIEETYLRNKKNSYAVGILALKSEFDGTVYVNNPRNRPDFTYNTEGKQSTAYRPFYVIFLGPYSEIVKYSQDILKQDQRNDNKLNLDSQFVVFSSEKMIERVIYLQGNSALPDGIERSFSLNDGKVAVEVNSPPYELLKLDKNFDKSELTINYFLDFANLKYGLTPQANSIETESKIQTFNASEKKFQELDSETLEQAVELKNWQIDQKENKLKFQTIIRPAAFPEPGIYLVTVDAVVKDWQTPDWWKDWDWTTKKGSQDGSKTYNLLTFMENLTRTTTNLMSAGDRKPIIGRFCYAIQKD